MSDSDSLPRALVETVPASELAPEFKTVTIDGKRRGFRLERLYWRLLGDIARALGVRRSILIGSVLARDGADASSDASVLRGFVAGTLEHERNSLSAALAQSKMIRLLQQAPLPAFAINRQKRLQLVNSEFNQLIRVTVGNMSQNVSTERLHLTLDARIEDLFTEAETRGWAVCNYNIALGDRGRRGRTKLVAVPPHPAEVLVGYVVS